VGKQRYVAASIADAALPLRPGGSMTRQEWRYLFYIEFEFEFELAFVGSQRSVFCDWHIRLVDVGTHPQARHRAHAMGHHEMAG